MATRYIYPIMDHHGNVVALTDENGNVTARREYNAFGEVLGESGDWTGFRMGYQSNWMQLREGNQTLYATPSGRIYMPEVGRFLQRDPKATPGSNPYTYASNSPVDHGDPTGYASEILSRQEADSLRQFLREMEAVRLASSTDPDEARVYAQNMPAIQAARRRLTWEDFLDRLRQEEGTRRHAYRDSLGKLTIGVGHSLDTGSNRNLTTVGVSVDDLRSGKCQLTDDQIDRLLRLDAQDAVNKARAAISTYDALPLVAQGILAEMAFQLAGGPAGFPNMLAALREQPPNFPKAADEMLDSQWARRQTPARARRLAALMRSLQPAAQIDF